MWEVAKYWVRLVSIFCMMQPLVLTTKGIVKVYINSKQLEGELEW